MSRTNTKRVTFPYAIKTVACNSLNAQPYSLQSKAPSYLTYACEMGMQIFPPLFTYAPQGLFMHLIYQFSTTVAVADRKIEGVYVRDTPSSYIGTGSSSSIEKYMPLNVSADANRKIELSLDLSSLLTGKATNVVFLRFPVNNYAQAGRLQDTVILWKLDLIYQTIGIRDEK